MAGHTTPALLVTRARAPLHGWWETHATVCCGLALTRKLCSPPDTRSGNQNEPSKAHPRYYLLMVRHKHPLINILHSKALAGLFF